jgi:hypothetical protein
LSRAQLLWLLALALALVFVAFEPLLTFPIFGSDTGEYYRLTAVLSSTGHLPLVSYSGWGSAYQDFPGIFVLSGATAGALGVDPLSALLTVVPLVATLAVFPLFLLFRRLFAQDTIAILGAGLASVAMPRIFSIAHPAPLALGDFLTVAALWMFVEGRRDRRWYFPLGVTAATLIVTHHLSSYFLLVSALGGLLLVELVAPGRWSRRFPLRELAFGVAFLVGLFVYWFEYAGAFVPIIGSGLFGWPVPALSVFLAGGLAAVVVMGALIRWRRRAPRRAGPGRVRLPSDRSLLRDFAVLFGGTLVGSAALVLVPVAISPATRTTSPLILAFFLPLILMIALGAGSRRLVIGERPGLFVLAWAGVLGLSAFVGIATQSSVILPSRHAEYLLIPVGLLAAIGIGRLIARLGDRSGRRAIAAGATAAVLLLAANAAIAYPPPALFGGFQEGLTAQDAALWMWVGIALPPNATVASDHRISSMIFGFDGNPSTWDSTKALFIGSNFSAALDELRSSDAPHPPHVYPVNAVAIDETMFAGVALDPNTSAYPLSAAAQAWFLHPPFILLYQSGAQAVYWVDGPLPPS